MFSLGLCLVSSTNAWADKIHDPTMPKYVVKSEPGNTKVEIIETPEGLSPQAASIESIKLQGILKRRGKTVAFISGQMYSVGDKIRGFKIGKINQDHVLLIGSGTQKRLYVYE